MRSCLEHTADFSAAGRAAQHCDGAPGPKPRLLGGVYKGHRDPGILTKLPNGLGLWTSNTFRYQFNTFNLYLSSNTINKVNSSPKKIKNQKNQILHIAWKRVPYKERKDDKKASQGPGREHLMEKSGKAESHSARTSNTRDSPQNKCNQQRDFLQFWVRGNRNSPCCAESLSTQVHTGPGQWSRRREGPRGH